MSIGLTQRQKEIALLIERYINKGYGSPTVREIAANLKISPKAVQDHINALCRKGVFTKEDRRSRGLRKVENKTTSLNNQIEKEIVKLNLKENITEDMELFEDQFIDTNKNINYKLNDNDNNDYIAFVLSEDFDTDSSIKKGDIAIIKLTNIKPKNYTIVAIKVDEKYSLGYFYKIGKDIKILSKKNDKLSVISSQKDIIGHLVEIRRKFKNA